MEGDGSPKQNDLNEVRTPEDEMGVDLGYDHKSSIRSNEENPAKPYNSLLRGKSEDKRTASEILASGEKDQKSDKDGATKNDSGWKNKTGERTRMATQAATGNMLGLARSVRRNGGVKRTLKVAGPVGTILIFLAIAFGSILGSQSTLLASLVGNLQLQYDPINITTNLRSKIIMKMTMKGSISANSKWSDFTAHQKRKLAKAGIDVQTINTGTKKYTVLKYTDDDNKVTYVAADAEAANSIKGQLGDVDVADFEGKIQNDNDFFVKYQDGTATWRTSVAAMYDKVAAWVFDKMHVTRNTFTDVEEKAPADGDYDAAKAAVDEDFDGEFQKATTGDTDIDAARHKTGEETDPETGETHTTYNEDIGQTTFGGDDEASIRQSIEDPNGAAQRALDSDDIAGGSGAAGMLSNIAEGTCQAYNIVTGMNRMIKAYELAQVVVMGMKVLEAIQRMQAGDGGGDVIADVVGNNLTEVVQQKVKTQSQSDTFGGDQYETLEGSVMSSNPIGAVFGGSQINSNTKEVKALIVPESIVRKILNAVGTNSGTGYKVCAMANLAANALDLIINIATLGAATIGGLIVGGASALLKGIVISGLVAFFVPRIAEMLTRKFDDVVKGPIGGAALSWATSHALGKNAQASGFRPAREDTLIKYAYAKEQVIAEETRYAKLTMSPFDTSSPYTFMGTLVRTLGSSFSTENSLIKNVSTFSNVANKSLNAFIPASYAGNKTVDELVSLGECTDLNSMNSGEGNEPIGDAFCEMVAVGDMTKINKAPDEVVKYLQNTTCTGVNNVFDGGKKAFGDNFDENADDFDKGLTVQKDTCLGKFIEEWTQREAPPGEPDDNIANSYQVSSGNSILDMLGSLFTLGALDFINSAETAQHLPNILGNEYTDPSSPNAEYYNVAEQFVTQERMREAVTGGEEKSAVSVYIDNYCKEHPLDNSFEGRLARYSGLSKRKVSQLLELGELMTFVANYDPSGYGPVYDNHEKPTVTLESTEEKPSNYFITNVPYIILDTPHNKRTITA